MAIGGKTAGMLSGLGVGVCGGVFLAAMNPILPKLPPEGVVQQAPASHSTALNTTKAPEVLPDQSSTAGAPDSQPGIPQTLDADTRPQMPDDPDRQPVGGVATDVAGLGDAQAPDAKLSLALPQADGGVAMQSDSGVLGEAAPEPALRLNTQTADPLPNPVPEVDTDVAGLGGAPQEDTQVALAAPETKAPLLSDVDTSPDQAGQDAPAAVDTTPGAAPSTSVDAEPAPTVPQTADAEDGADEKAEPEPQQRPRFPTISGDADEDGDTNRVGTFQTRTATNTRRFPTIGGSNDGGSRLPSINTTETAAAATSDPDSGPVEGALLRNRLPFEGADRALISIIVIDNGRFAEQAPQFQQLGLPIAVAVAVDEDGAADRAAAYRAAGFEVLAMAPRSVDLSLSGNQSQDQVTALLDQYFDIMPDAIGLIDRPQATLQKDRRLARQVVTRFAASGHGLVTFASGLNAVPRLAADQEVSAGTVYRYLDASGERGAIINRYLNRAAFEAKSKGRVIVMATPSLETVEQFATWLSSRGARDVAIAPVSANLLAE
ncbi:MAG: divergent polysaccharide deacetylase family protein [Pseudomonadota bacterium]